MFGSGPLESIRWICAQWERHTWLLWCGGAEWGHACIIVIALHYIHVASVDGIRARTVGELEQSSACVRDEMMSTETLRSCYLLIKSCRSLARSLARTCGAACIMSAGMVDDDLAEQSIDHRLAMAMERFALQLQS